MKSAYELAMERLAKDSPAVRLTDEQKKELAELESQCKARIAERELLLKAELQKAIESGDQEAIAASLAAVASQGKSK